VNIQSIENLASQLISCSDDEREALIAAIQEKENYLRVLNTLATSMIQIHNQEDLLWFVAKEVVGKLGFVDCVIYLLDVNDQTLVPHAAMGEKSPEGRRIVNPLHIPMGIGVTGRVASQAMPILVNDLSKYPGYVEDINPALSELCVPLIYSGEVIGVIDCENPHPHHFTSDHLELLTSVAAMTSSKLKECEFVAKLEKQNQNLLVKLAKLERLMSPQNGSPSNDLQQNLQTNILIVEDNYVNLVITSKFVQSYGCKMTTASNGQEALELIKSGSEDFDLILMDIRMPVMDGIEATRAIRRLPAPICDIPIIAVTANADPEESVSYLSAGINAVIPKPIDKEKLRRAILGLTNLR